MAGQSSIDVAAAFPIQTVLRDGTPVLIRQIQPEDKHLLEIGLEHLSPQDRHSRFFGPVSKLSDKVLRQFTEIDHVTHEAMIALDISETPGNPVGVARYIRIPGTNSYFEVAVTIIDNHQGKGLGTLLLAVLAHRTTENGITDFTASVLGDNHRMLELFKELGATTAHATAGEMDILIPLFADATLYPQTPVGDVFRQVSAMLAANPKPGARQ